MYFVIMYTFAVHKREYSKVDSNLPSSFKIETDVTEEPAAWCYSGSQPAQSWLVAATNDSTTNDSAPFHSMHSCRVYVVPKLTRAFKYKSM